MLLLYKANIFAYKVLYKVIKSNTVLSKIHLMNKKLLKFKGVIVGDNSVIINCIFSSSSKGDSFIIGDNCTCTCTGVSFIGHDASPTIFIEQLNVLDNPNLPGARRSYRKRIEIGNNVFIGHGVIILPGVKISDNCVVAAGSIVNKNLDSGWVYAGNPAKKIKKLEEYVEKYNRLLECEPESF